MTTDHRNLRNLLDRIKHDPSWQYYAAKDIADDVLALLDELQSLTNRAQAAEGELSKHQGQMCVNHAKSPLRDDNGVCPKCERDELQSLYATTRDALALTSTEREKQLEMEVSRLKSALALAYTSIREALADVENEFYGGAKERLRSVLRELHKRTEVQTTLESENKTDGR